MIGVELRKLVLRPRMWVSVGLLCLLPAIVAVFLATADFPPPPGQGGAFLSAVVSDGSLYPAAALALVLPLFLPIAVAVAAGDSIAGEAAGGTLRYLLVRPVGRTRLLVAKLVTVAVYVTAAIAFVVLTSLVVGVLLFGTGGQGGVVGGGPAAGVVSMSGTALSSTSLGWRLLGAVAYIVVSMVGFAAITVFLSTTTDSALAAALGGLAVLITSSVLETLDAAASLKPYLPTHYWLSWIDFFRDPVLWRNIDQGLLLQAGYIVVFFGAAWANFATRDVTS
ncbi:ABC transporter permease [Amycolatopsis thermophila]|uniref:ABC-2 type transport system permease protein n=1 Tax=Amycolatopsis thermophila TaxID=206084 RepID=A0ABU0F4R6_9PSEU|nr:ABC transporter permease [Amycolatopsis thermophila]MDQ0382580.1 ABC-2 type transport system permease protein [Amycolatopsis thermophila]